MAQYNIAEIKQISIKDYLESRGIKVEQNGNKYFCSSPFARDSNWSFCIYPSNTFYCWSTGISGDIISLVQKIETLSFPESLEHLSKGNYPKYVINYKKFKDDEDLWKNFDISKYINNNEEEKQRIISYGQSRSISSGFDCGVYFTRNADSSYPRWIRNPAMMFTHVDKDLNICGAKFRKIYDDGKCDGNNGPRFSSRGHLGFYILDTGVLEAYEESKVWLCESETSSNSLWEYFREQRTSATIISMGGVSSAPRELPLLYKNRKIKLIIDYDGNEHLYNERLKRYEHLGVEPIKIILPKGEDINSLYHRGEIWKIEGLLK